MHRSLTSSLLGISLFALLAAAPASQPTPNSIYETTARSLVIVQYTWHFELGDRRVRSAGIIVDHNGTVMLSASTFDDRVPESQIKDVNILLPRPGAEPLQVEAGYLGRNDRSHLAFVKPRQTVDWSPLSFSSDSVHVGEAFYSVGLMTEGTNGIKPYLLHGTVSAVIPGERTQVLADGRLAGAGSPVLDSAGEPIGFIDAQPAPQQKDNEENSANVPLAMFISSSDFAQSLLHAGEPDPVAWFGVVDMTGLSQDLASYYGLNTPAVQISSVMTGSPADSAGLAQGDIITELNGHSLESGDTPDQIPALFRRQLIQCSPDQTIKLMVVKERGKASVPVQVKLASTPPRPNTMPRYWVDSLGFGVRDVSFIDRYTQHMLPSDGGVIVSVAKPDGAALSAHLPISGLILNVNGKPVSNVADFKKEYSESRATAPQAAVLLLVRTKGQEETIRIEPPR